MRLSKRSRAFMAALACAGLSAMGSAALAQDREASAATAEAEATTPAGFDLQAVGESLTGAWSGELAYRDYQSNRRFAIPMRILWSTPADGSHLLADIIFTDPGREVYAVSVTQAVGGAGVRVSYFREGDIDVALRRVASFEANETGWTAVYEERGRDGGEPALIRYTETLDGASYKIVKEAQPEGEDDFAFRNEVVLTREEG